MSTGLSMASVNKIKELANQREYSLALEIVDSQDLSKSLNPQFLRLCGDIFSHAKRYRDARKVLLMAHRLAPESKRIIASIIELYLHVGYKELAQKYYDIYMFDADENTIETKQVKYAYDNAYRKEPAWLLSYLEAAFHHNMDYEWSYKTYLLLKAVNRDNDAKALADIYLPTYKNTEFADVIETIENDGGSTEERIYVYAKQWIEDNSEDEQELRIEEEKLLEADELRIHPKEAEITIMFEEMGDGTEELSKRKLKKLMKEQEKEAKEAEEKAKQTEENGEQEAADEPAKEQEKGLLKKLFKKNKKAETDTETEKNTEAENEKSEAENAETARVEVEHKVNIEAEEPKTEQSELESGEVEDKENIEIEEPKTEQSELESGEVEDKENIEIEEPKTEQSEPESGEVEDKENIEIEEPKTEQSEPESGEVEDKENIEIEEPKTERSEPESGEVEDKEDTENGTEKDTKETVSLSNFKFVIEDAEIISDTDDISDVDDEIVEEQDSEAKELWGSNESNDEDTDMRELHLKGRESKTGLVVSVDDDFDDFTAESETIDDLSGDADYSNPFESISAIKKEKEEHRFMPKRKTEFVFEEAQLSDTDFDDGDIDEFVTDDVDDEFGRMEVVEEETSLDTEEAESETANLEIEEPKEAETETVNFEIETEKESDAEDFEFDFGVEPKTSFEVEKEAESVAVNHEIEETKETEATDFKAKIEKETEKISFSSERETKTENKPDYSFINQDYKSKNKLDFPVFKSSLFPEHNKEIKDVENNFHELMEEAQDKMQENLLKEEQMQKEAEALLASLGIDLGSVKVKPPDNNLEKTNTVKLKDDKASRDALKASLKIDSVKRDTLRKLKEYR